MNLEGPDGSPTLQPLHNTALGLPCVLSVDQRSPGQAAGATMQDPGVFPADRGPNRPVAGNPSVQEASRENIPREGDPRTPTRTERGPPPGENRAALERTKWPVVRLGLQRSLGSASLSPSQRHKNANCPEDKSCPRDGDERSFHHFLGKVPPSIHTACLNVHMCVYACVHGDTRMHAHKQCALLGGIEAAD